VSWLRCTFLTLSLKTELLNAWIKRQLSQARLQGKGKIR
jgi:hypothetical protein